MPVVSNVAFNAADLSRDFARCGFQAACGTFGATGTLQRLSQASQKFFFSFSSPSQISFHDLAFSGPVWSCVKEVLQFGVFLSFTFFSLQEVSSPPMLETASRDLTWLRERLHAQRHRCHCLGLSHAANGLVPS